MHSIARRLSPRAEFCVVVLVAFGYFVVGNVLSLIYPSATPPITDESLRFLVAFEVVVLFLLGPLLYARGWRLSRFTQPPVLRDIGAAIALALLAYALSSVVALAAAALHPGLVSSLPGALVSDNIALGTLLAISTVNPVFEEVLLCGYIVTVLKERRGFWTAVNTSLAIRLTCHLYQGPVGVIGIVPLGFIFTYWYARTGRLWPLIVAHALFDILGLWPFLSD